MTYFPLPHHLSRDATHGILAMNHEDTDPEMMFPGYQAGSPTPEQVDSEMAAHGVTIVELVHLPVGEWRYRIASDFNRRITGETASNVRKIARTAQRKLLPGRFSASVANRLTISMVAISPDQSATGQAGFLPSAYHFRPWRQRMGRHGRPGLGV